MPTTTPRHEYRERLWPSISLLLVLLLLLPAVAMIVMPIEPSLAPPIAVGVYALVIGVLLLLSPTITVADGILTAGNARIPVTALGDAEPLDADTLRHLIGVGADARAYLLVRGFIHRGVRVQVIDNADPTPYWLLTTRHPRALATALHAARHDSNTLPLKTPQQ